MKPGRALLALVLLAAAGPARTSDPLREAAERAWLRDLAAERLATDLTAVARDPAGRPAAGAAITARVTQVAFRIGALTTPAQWQDLDADARARLRRRVDALRLNQGENPAASPAATNETAAVLQDMRERGFDLPAPAGISEFNLLHAPEGALPATLDRLAALRAAGAAGSTLRVEMPPISAPPDTPRVRAMLDRLGSAGLTVEVTGLTALEASALRRWLALLLAHPAVNAVYLPLEDALADPHGALDDLARAAPTQASGVIGSGGEWTARLRRGTASLGATWHDLRELRSVALVQPRQRVDFGLAAGSASAFRLRAEAEWRKANPTLPITGPLNLDAPPPP